MWNHLSLLQYLWDGLSVGVCLVDHEGVVTHMNVPGSRILGWGAVCPTNVSYEKVFDLLNPGNEECPPDLSLLETLKEKKMVWLPRVRLRCRQGNWCWVELKGMAIEEDGTIQFLLMFRDLSSETQLAEDYSRLASIPEESPFPIIEVDAAGHLLYANPSMLCLMENAQIGQDGFTTALPNQFPELVARCFTQGYLESNNVEVRVGEKYYAWSFSSHPELGRLRGYGMDITDSKRASAELSAFAETLEIKNQELDQALLKAEAATRTKATFLAMMSHEIRTPLNGVIGMAELLLNSTLDVKQQECTKIIRKSGEGLLAIINDILDFSKIESGHMSLENIEFNPLMLVEEVLDLFSERAYHKGLDIAAYVAPNIPFHLLGDPHRLRQILCNFISNALKFTSHGTVFIEVTWLSGGAIDSSSSFRKKTEAAEMGIENPVGSVRFAVKDSGIGMSPSVQRKIFQVFTQADSSMSRKFGGSGLGLAICKQLAELMNGTVGVESQMGQGATFWCDLPFSSLPTQSHVRSNRCIDKAILLCCLPDISTQVVSRYLQDRGVRIVRVEQVNDAVTFFENNPAFSSEMLGIIMGKEAKDEAWRTWLETVRACMSPKFRIWGLIPFWRKDLGEYSDMFHGMITMPIHRDQLYDCVFHESEVAVVKHSGAGEDSDTVKVCEVVSDQGGKPLVDEHVHTPAHLGPSVLIVEDNPVNQKVAAGLFEKLGCQVYVAESGDRALALVQEYPIDVVMMDWELPEMDGFETSRAIRKFEEMNRLAQPRSFLHVPIVGMTAHGQSEQNQSQWEEVMDDCIVKPVHLQDLAKVLERWVGFISHSRDHQAASRDTRLQVNLPEDTAVEALETEHAQGDRQAIYDKYDYTAALKYLEGDEVLLHSLVQIFLETGPHLIQSMRDAIGAKDRQLFQRYMHQLKSALFAIHACEQAHVAERLEAKASMALFPELQVLWGSMEREMEGLLTLLMKSQQVNSQE